MQGTINFLSVLDPPRLGELHWAAKNNSSTAQSDQYQSPLICLCLGVELCPLNSSYMKSWFIFMF